MKLVLLAGVQPVVWLVSWIGPPISRILCLAWARAQLGADAVPAENQILGMIRFHGTRRIRMGRDCRIYRNVHLETQGSGKIDIGDHVVISTGAVIASHERVVIGSYTMIGEYCSIRDADHGMEQGQPIRRQHHNAAPVTIAEDVWIGRGVAILKGVTIGSGAIIGANSVVTSDVPAMTVVAGCPARVLRHRVRPDSATDTQPASAPTPEPS